MKKYILIALSGLILFTGCEDFLNQDNPNKVPAETYFNNENDAERALYGAYLALRTNYCLGEGSYAYTEERSDNMGRLDNQSSSGEPFQFTDFSLLPGNTYLKSHWNAMYTALTRANFVLTGIEKLEFEEVSRKKEIEAEARFLRALIYFQLVRKWGEVPLITRYLTDTDEITAHTYREDKEVIYGQIIQDLKDGLESNLPDIQPESGKGRACKAAINGLLGQVYLTYGLLKADKDRQEHMENAKKYLTDCYEMRKFGSLHEIPYPDVFNVNLKSTCPEIIFQIVYIQGDRDYSSSIAASNQARGITLNSQKVSTGSGNFVNPDLVKEYEAGDIRGEWSVIYADDPVANQYIITKYRDISDAAGTLGYGGNDAIIMRYADIMLLLAEAHLYLGDEAGAIRLLNEVRQRAGMPDYATMRNDETYNQKYPTLKLALLHERRVELAFENHRWFDLLRYFTATELQDYIHNKDQSDYGISNIHNFGPKDIYYPIPYDEWKLNPEKMWQNPGY